MAGSPADDLARRLGIGTGRIAVPAGLLAILAGAALFVFPPHSTIAAIALGLAGVVCFAFGSLRLAGGPWWAFAAALISGGVLFAALTVGGRGLALNTFGGSQICEVAQRQEVDTAGRYQHYGFVHTLNCPRGGTFTIRTDATDRQPPGSRAEVLGTPGGVLEPDFAGRHNVIVEALAVAAALALAGATVHFTWRRSGVRSAS
ncbi:hypothetical protein HFP15_37610 [Amycolatopsis sp. K13G38]|uniref:Uncharacterized protein n=1 Tax=Amycolatopsis acididurans TaxID=2724524 RepID=A0ABX1JFR2_9PSEU|nr:hypothetical protein [Amycolatopsis acididurans]NKQ58578.1 hypothetical protein [Amycolatopsis acididurans]